MVVCIQARVGKFYGVRLRRAVVDFPGFNVEAIKRVARLAKLAVSYRANQHLPAVVINGYTILVFSTFCCSVLQTTPFVQEEVFPVNTNAKLTTMSLTTEP